MNQVTLNFNGGELSPYLRHRTDFAKHPGAAAVMQNLIPLPFGPVTRRPGTQFLSTLASTITANSRAFPFTASDGARYIILILPGTIRIIGTDGVQKASLTFLDSSADVTRAHFAQINDVAYITHPGTHPRLLTTTGDTSWELSFVPFTTPPTLDRNLDATRFISIYSNPQADGWITATPYSINATVNVDAAEWECRVPHTSSPATRPVTGANYRAFWQRKLFKAGDPVTIVSYGVDAPDWRYEPRLYTEKSIWNIPQKHHPDLDDLVSTPGPYAALSTHTTYSVSGGTLTDFASKWRRIQQTYIWEDFFSFAINIGDLYYDTATAKLYRAHTAKTVSEVGPTFKPETGSDWETVWADVTSEYDFTNFNTLHTYPHYAQGQTANIAGTVYQADATHYIVTATNRPGTGSDWETFWTLQTDTPALFNTLHAAATGISPGSYWEISPSREDTDYQIQVRPTTSNQGPSQPIAVQGPWVFNTFGTWNGIYRIQRSRNNGASWETIRTHESAADRNIADSGIEPTAALLRIHFTAIAGTATGSTSARATLTPERTFIESHAIAETYVGPNLMRGKALAPMLSGTTSRWAEGAFSRLRGHPQALTFHDQRFCLAGTTFQPTTLWISEVDAYQSFGIGPAATDAITVTLATGTENRIRWLASQRRLFIGTRTGEWIAGGTSNESPITPTELLVRQYTAYGSAHLQPVSIADSFIFIGRNRQRLREIAYNDERAAYIAPELTRLADHLTKDGIRSLAWQQSREPGLWSTAGGRLLHFAYAREDQITAWSRHTTHQGEFLHVIAFPGDQGDDLIYTIQNRTHGETTTPTIEAIPPNWFSLTEDGGTHPFDCTITATGDDPVTTPAFLDGVELTAIIDGTPTTVTPAAGQVTLPEGTATAEFGFPIHVSLESLPIDLSDGGPGGTHSTRRRAHEISLRIRDTSGGTITYDGTTEPLDIPVPSFTGWHDKTLPPAHADDLIFRIDHSTPAGFTLLAMALRWRPTEKPH